MGAHEIRIRLGGVSRQRAYQITSRADFHRLRRRRPTVGQPAGDRGFAQAACQLWLGGEGDGVGTAHGSGSPVEDFGRYRAPK
jgi:hypothetical protein